MLKWALIFFLVSLVAGFLGFTGVAATAAGVAKFLFFLFLIVCIAFLIAGIWLGERFFSRNSPTKI